MDMKRMNKMMCLVLLLVSNNLWAQAVKAPLAVTLLEAQSTKQAITLRWDMPKKTNAKYIVIYRKGVNLQDLLHADKKTKTKVKIKVKIKQNRLGPVLKRIAITQQHYVDTLAQPHTRYYYRVVLEGETGLQSDPSLPAIAMLTDNEPPLKVESLMGKAVDATHLNLRWTASNSDDVTSYRIYRWRKGVKPVIYRSIKTSPENAIYDITIKQKKNLELSYQYAIAAIDFAGNVAPFSTAVTLRLPDSIAPSAPLLIRAKQDNQRMKITWRHNLERDLKGYRVYRKDDVKGASFVALHKNLVLENHFNDDTIDAFKAYRYQVTAVDDYGNESALGKGVLKRTTRFTTPILAPQLLKISTNKKGYPVLNWHYKGKMPAIKMRVLRSENDTFKIVSGLLDRLSYTDYSVVAGKAYRYQIEAVSAYGERSQSSNTALWLGGDYE